MTTQLEIMELLGCVRAASPREAWETCPRGDWMLRALGELGISRDECTAIGYWCAERAPVPDRDPAAWANEHLAIADEVRRRIPWETVEAAIAGMEKEKHS